MKGISIYQKQKKEKKGQSNHTNIGPLQKWPKEKEQYQSQKNKLMGAHVCVFMEFRYWMNSECGKEREALNITLLVKDERKELNSFFFLSKAAKGSYVFSGYLPWCKNQQLASFSQIPDLLRDKNPNTNFCSRERRVEDKSFALSNQNLIAASLCLIHLGNPT